MYAGMGKLFVCETKDYSSYFRYSDALAVCYTKMPADFLLSLSNFSNENRRLRQVTSVSDFVFRYQ